MSKHEIRSGNLCVEVDAESYEVAVKQAITNAPTGTELGLLIKVKESGKTFYLLTEKFLQDSSMLPEPEMVSLHSIYCDCERCAEVRQRGIE